MRRSIGLALATLLAGCSTSDPGSLHAIPAPGAATSANGSERRPHGLVRQSSAGKLTADEERLYFAAEVDPQKDDWIDSPSVLWSAPKAGGAPVELARWATRFGDVIALDGDELFYGRVGTFVPNPDACPEGKLCQAPDFHEGPTGAIVRVSKRGGPEVILAAGVARPGAVVVDGDDVFFVDHERLGRVSRQGGPVTYPAAGLPCSALGVSREAIHCGGAKGLTRVPRSGGPPTTVLRSGSVLGDRVFVHGETVTFELHEAVPLGPDDPPPDPRLRYSQGGAPLRPTKDVYRVVSWSPGDTEVRTVADHPVEHLVSDGASLIWSRDRELVALPLGAWSAKTAQPFPDGSPRDGLAVDRAWVHWLSRDGTTHRARR